MELYVNEYIIKQQPIALEVQINKFTNKTLVCFEHSYLIMKSLKFKNKNDFILSIFVKYKKCLH